MSGGFKVTLAIIFVVAGIFFYITNKPNTGLTPEEEAKAARASARANANIKPRDNVPPAPAQSAAPAEGAAPAVQP